MSGKRKHPSESTNSNRRPKKRRLCHRVPAVLYRAFGGGARSLEETILSLLPHPPPSSSSNCRCGGVACLGCCRRRHLLRDGDPREYRDLLGSAYCFVKPDAPPPPERFHRVGWDQRKIVRNVMEESLKSNALSAGYEEQSRFSSTGEVLCTSAWDILLERIGDNFMAFLLRFSSIFLPLSDKTYQQVTGPFLNEILQGHYKKREQISHDEKPERSTCNGALQSSCTDGLAKTSTCRSDGKSKKQTRTFSWQRRKLRKMSSRRCYFCQLETPDENAAAYEINRRRIFYSTTPSNFTFPAGHILNRVKPNEVGAALLMKHIFGLSNEVFHSCTKQRGPCTRDSNCLYRRLLVLLKSLIRNARYSNHKKLLLRHCLFQSLEQGNDNDNYEIEGESSSPVRCEKKLRHSQKSSRNKFPGSQLFSDINCEHVKLSEKHSSISDSKIDLSECYASHHQVVSFVWAVCRSIIPADLLGDSSIWRALRSSISNFVGLQRFDKFTIRKCLDMIQTSKHPFVLQFGTSDCLCYKFWAGNCSCTSSGNSKASKVNISLHSQFFRRWICWLFSSVIVPIISAHFYVTERQFKRLQIFYYPKPVWRKYADNVIISLEKQNYKQLAPMSCTSIVCQRKFGYSKVRLLPKKNKVRILANTKAPCKIQIEHRSFFVKSVHSSLKEMLAILRRIKHENPQALGSSVFSYDDVHQKLYRFLQKIKCGQLMIPKMYIVVGDVANAFDTINQDKLINVMKELILKDKYNLRSYRKVISSAQKQSRTSQDYVAYHQDSCVDDVIKFEAATRLQSYCVIIDQGEQKCMEKEELHHLVTEHLKCQILKIGGKFYLQKMGICQGGSISPLLCSLYLGHLERSIIFPYLEEASKQLKATGIKKELLLNGRMQTSSSCTESSNYAYNSTKSKPNNLSCSGSSIRIDDISSETKYQSQKNNALEIGNSKIGHDNLSSPSYLLLRWSDDFIFISTSKQQALSFFRRMSRGFIEYNCEMNSRKFGANFDVGQKSHVELLQHRLYIGADGIQFIPWSGVLVNCQTLEIQADYTRYLDIPMSSTITVTSKISGLSGLKAKLCDFTRPKCHALLYDAGVNSSRIVRLNAYQTFLLCAMKFHCYFRRISDKSELHPSCILEAIDHSFRFMYGLIKKQMRKMEDCYGMNPILELKEEEMIWLGLSAYIRVLKKKPTSYKELLKLLSYRISAYGKMVRTSDSLKYAIDDSHSSVFQNIRF